MTKVSSAQPGDYEGKQTTATYYLTILCCLFSYHSVDLSVRQLIKSQRVQNKLGIVFEKEKDKSQRKDFIFASAKVSAYTHIWTQPQN